MNDDIIQTSLEEIKSLDPSQKSTIIEYSNTAFKEIVDMKGRKKNITISLNHYNGYESKLVAESSVKRKYATVSNRLKKLKIAKKLEKEVLHFLNEEQIKRLHDTIERIAEKCELFIKSIKS